MDAMSVQIETTASDPSLFDDLVKIHLKLKGTINLVAPGVYLATVWLSKINGNTINLLASRHRHQTSNYAHLIESMKKFSDRVGKPHQSSGCFMRWLQSARCQRYLWILFWRQRAA